MTMERTRLSAVVLGAIGLAYAIAQVRGLPPVPVLEPDSASYLAFSPIRTALYPLALRGVGPEAMIVLQPILYAIAAVALALCVLAVDRRPLSALAVLAGLLINPELNATHGQIMTESLFMTALLAFLAATIVFLRAPGWRGAVVMGLLAGLAAAIRPTGYAVCPGLIVAVLLAPRGNAIPARSVLLAAAVLSMLAMVGGERLYTASIHGDQATSLAGRHFYAKAVLVEAPSRADAADPAVRRLAFAAEQTFAPIRSLLEQAPNEEIRSLLSKTYETCLEYACVDPLRREIGLPEPRMNAVALSFGLDRLAAAPLSYARLVWLNYRSMWALYPQSHPALAPAFVAFVEQHRPLPFADLVPMLDAKAPESRAALVVRPVMISVGFVTALAGLLAAAAAVLGWRVGAVAAGGLIAALSVHACLLWTAIVGVGVLRYTISMWPLIVPALALAVLSRGGLWDRLRGLALR